MGSKILAGRVWSGPLHAVDMLLYDRESCIMHTIFLCKVIGSICWQQMWPAKAWLWTRSKGMVVD